MTKTKNSELTKIINSMEALGYQVDFIEMLPEGAFHTIPDQCLLNIKASPLVKIQISELPEQT